MNIAFDLDDTLIPTTVEFAGGSKSLNFPLNVVYHERLRMGAPELLKELGATSQRHVADTRGTEFSGYSKAPKFYGIDILVDDQEGVAIECEKQGKRAIIIDPNDVNWVEKIRSEVRC